MNCPKCKAQMERVTFANVEVDRCTACKGLWFDARELERLVKEGGSEVIDSGDAELGQEHNLAEHTSCPVCTTPMIPMVDEEQPHIWFERCSVCFGSYFDAGEFRDLKE